MYFIHIKNINFKRPGGKIIFTYVSTCFDPYNTILKISFHTQVSFYKFYISGELNNLAVWYLVNLRTV